MTDGNVVALCFANFLNCIVYIDISRRASTFCLLKRNPTEAYGQSCWVVDPGTYYCHMQLIAKLLISNPPHSHLTSHTQWFVCPHRMDCTLGEKLAVQPGGIDQDARERCMELIEPKLPGRPLLSTETHGLSPRIELRTANLGLQYTPSTPWNKVK